MKSSGVFIFQSINGPTFTPAQLGYFSLRWALDLAKDSIESLKNTESCINGLISKASSRPFAAELQYMALYFAAHFTYATMFCNIPEAAIREMLNGLNDAVNELRDSEGSQYDGALRDILNYSIGQYHNAQKKDLTDDVTQGVLNLDSSNVAQKFVDLLSRTYDHKFATNEHFENMIAINMMVTDSVLAIYKSMRQQGLVFSES